MALLERFQGGPFPRRMVHLDFHTGPDIPEVGAAFDADAFARTFKDAHVDSQRLGSVYSHLEACEPYVNGGRTCAEVAVVVDAGLGDSPGPEVIGAVRVLQQLRHQFDVVGAEAPLDGYKVVVVPGSTPIDRPLAGRLQAYVDGGGSLVLSAAAAAASQEGRRLLRAFGWEVGGTAPFSTTFLRLSPSEWLTPPVPRDLRVHGEALLLDEVAPAETLAEIVYPYFERSFDHFSGHSYTPPEKLSGRAAVARNRRVVVFAVPILAGVAEEGNEEYRPFPLVDIDVALRLESAPRRVTLQPAGQELAFSYDGTYASARVTALQGHGILVFDTEGK